MSLPSGYKRIEYIESSGTQYIDTGFKPNQNTRVLCEFLTKASSTSLFGSQEAWGSKSYSFGSNTASFEANATTSLSFNDGVKHIVDFKNNSISVDDNVLLNYSGTFQINYDMYVLANNEKDTTVYYSSAKLYSCQIYDNGALIRDYIPCQTTAGEIGLWDDVNNVFYTNSGTGTFEAGPEVTMVPKAPTVFSASPLTDTTVKLSWTASDGATGYKLYKLGDLISTLTDTSYTDTLELFSGYTYSVTAYNDDGESEATTLTYYAVPENPILYLVTDRTAADVTAKNAKGTYNASDLNRVGAAMNYVADRLRAAGYDPHISPKTDWKDDDWVDPAAQAVYLCDLSELRKQFSMMESTPEVPPRILATGINTKDGLTYTLANDIEKILEDVDALLTNISAAWFFSGDLFSVEV